MQLHNNEKIVCLVERLFGYHVSLKKRQLELISDLSEKHGAQIQSYNAMIFDKVCVECGLNGSFK